MKRTGTPSYGRRTAASGFSLIEVMVAILVLGFGLLGFALLQTMSVRFTQSANYRTQATNLTYELFDQMRANRILASAYLGNYSAVDAGADCVAATGVGLTAAQYRATWQCRLGKALGANASATVVQAGNDITVNISWADDRWDATVTDPRTFTATTQL